jgi:predicted nuclease of restriction endonuclease-like RecB superfamily
MLTRDLLRAQIRGREIRPSLIDPRRPKLREDAGALLDLFRAAVEERWTRSRLEEEVADQIGDRRDHKLVRGFAKVLLDRSSFEVHSPVPPGSLRDRVFRVAQDRGPLSLEPGPLGRPVAEDVLDEVGREWGLSAREMEDALYADRPAEQRITRCDAADADWLLHRYNLALAQAILLHATRVQVRLVAPTVPRLRQLFRAVKFHQLIHQVERDGEVVVVALDGPTSLFRMSTRYGLQLATFLPALALQECRWSLEATVLWTRARHRKRMFLTSEDGLVSHYRDVGAYETRTQRWFAERFRALDSGWTLDDQTLPIDLGGRALVLPDYRFTREGRVAFLEIVGFWRREYLERRLEWLARYAPGNLVLAVSRKLRVGEGGHELPGAVIEFAEVVPPKRVLEAIEAVATPRS